MFQWLLILEVTRLSLAVVANLFIRIYIIGMIPGQSKSIWRVHLSAG